MSFSDALLLIESGIYNKDLHHKFWYNKKFDQGVRRKLLRIASDFIENSKITEVYEFMDTAQNERTLNIENLNGQSGVSGPMQF